ncbi:hypothetical protein ATO11_13215 [Pseudaestuariivita atlantica]|uniref:Uncharacterized protein n=2 Tax=Pseudaestuariivita atlantica TaxID=1317121 RepID=A0A0L1JNU1_9RHOB|nr:hypothetical protein ATO11_13215 [Pseudaestuariivita atlantica]
MIAGSALAPALPGAWVGRRAGARAAAGYAGYNRLLYGLAVQQAQTSGGLSARALASRLGLTLTRAQGLMNRIVLRGALVPAAHRSVTASRVLKAAAIVVEQTDRDDSA